MAQVQYLVLYAGSGMSFDPIAEVVAASPDAAIDIAIARSNATPTEGQAQQWAAVPVRFWTAKTVGVEQPPPVVTMTDWQLPAGIPRIGVTAVEGSPPEPEAADADGDAS